MRALAILIGVLLTISPSFLFGQGSDKGSAFAAGAECVEDLTIPLYSVLAWTARAAGPVDASVTIGQNASVAAVNVEEKGGPKILNELVKKALGSARFLPACAGRTVYFHFLYRLNGEVADSMPAPEVRYKGGASFEIVARPPRSFLYEGQPSTGNAQ